MDQPSSLLGQVYGTQYQPDSRTGHYGSFFVRANHPARPLALFCQPINCIERRVAVHARWRIQTAADISVRE